MGTAEQQFRPSTAEMPQEFGDPEGDAELLDPDLPKGGDSDLETTSARLRILWGRWECGEGAYVDQLFFGSGIGGIPLPAKDAYAALENALRSTGYTPQSRWAYNCRLIADTKRWSLHSYGIAIDIDPKQNPYSDGDPFSGLIHSHHVSAVLGIRNPAGSPVWSWGGNWSKPDRMHFQLERGPDAVEVDWSTVPGADASRTSDHSDGALASRPTMHIEEENMLSEGAEGKAVEVFQSHLLAWNGEALPDHGADGNFGGETAEWIRIFQREFGLEPAGTIDGVTAALLARHD